MPVVVFEDAFGFTRPGAVFYPEALRQISGVLAELNGEDILEPRSFNANIELYLDLIMGRFRSFHDTHRTARSIHAAYRAEGRQYCVYLRSFSLGGIVLGTNIEGERLTQQQGWTATDRAVRTFVKASLPAGVGALSFVNTFDLYPSGNERDESVEYMERATVPSFRVLSHNWVEVVREVVRGAKLVVLNSQGEGEGLDQEIRLIRECGLAPRTIVTGQDLRRRGIRSTGEFGRVIEFEAGQLDPGNPEARALRKAIREFASDDFVQTNIVEDLSALRCWVIDRGISAAAKKSVEERYAGIPYDHLVPGSLAGNWEILQARFPEMEREWMRVESTIAAGGRPGVEELAEVLYAALAAFLVATTLERYREMSMALATMGMAHRAITRTVRIMAACYGHATQCAEWLGDAELAGFFGAAHESLLREAAASDAP